MRIGIISDTHDKLKRTVAAVEMLRAEGAEVLFHCGDITRPDVVYALAGLPSFFVFGNNDDEFAALRRAINQLDDGVCLEWAGTVTLAGKRIAMTHGHLTSDMRSLAAERPDYLFFGHSHIASDRRDGPTRWINPGALHRADAYSVALLDLTTDELRFLPISKPV